MLVQHFDPETPKRFFRVLIILSTLVVLGLSVIHQNWQMAVLGAGCCALGIAGLRDPQLFPRSVLRWETVTDAEWRGAKNQVDPGCSWRENIYQVEGFTFGNSFKVELLVLAALGRVEVWEGGRT